MPDVEEAPPQSVAPKAASTEAGDDWATRYKYLLADFENYRRRTDRERESIARQTRASLLLDLLPLYEAVQGAGVALAAGHSAADVRRGLDLLDREWQRLLVREGVEPVAQVGAAFHAEEAEAVAEAPPTGNQAEGSVVEIVQQGYRFPGGLLRPAKVVVARGPRSDEAEGVAPPPDPKDPPEHRP
ncbi:MAG: nucleotide exchange factor GrpE [Thermoplasmata archaeon]|jgi:molecular chaperone GrpE